MSSPLPNSDWEELKSFADILLKQAVGLHVALMALRGGDETSSGSPSNTEAKAEGARAARIRFDPTTHDFVSPSKRLNAYESLVEGMELGYDSRQAVIAYGRWRPDDSSVESLDAVYRLRIEDPAATAWLSLEFLVDSASVCEIGFATLHVALQAAPTARLEGYLRVFTNNNRSIDLPLTPIVVGMEPVHLVDATRVPTYLLTEINRERPMRYVLNLPRTPIELTVREALVFPASSSTS